MNERDIGGPPSIGAYRVGTNFNPSGADSVNRLKEHGARFIDECQRQWDDMAKAQPDEPTQADEDLFMEQSRLFRIAQERAEEAAMWAVKAATKRPRGGAA